MPGGGDRTLTGNSNQENDKLEIESDADGVDHCGDKWAGGHHRNQYGLFEQQ
jgi:hypothetical protein